MTDRNFNAEEKAKLTQLIREGSTVMQEVEDLNGSLSDTIKRWRSSQRCSRRLSRSRTRAILVNTAMITACSRTYSALLEN